MGLLLALYLKMGWSKHTHVELKRLDSANALIAIWPQVDPDINAFNAEGSSSLMYENAR